MSATQIIDFLQANAVLITFDPAVEYPAGYIVEYDQKLYIANDVIPANTGFLEGNTGATFSVLNPTNGLTDAELRAAPVDVTSSIYIREDRWICLNDGPAPVEYLQGHQLRRMEFFDTVSGTNSFVWFNLSTNTSLTESPLPADVILNGPATEIKQDVGNQVLNDVKTRLPTSVGLKTEDLSLSVTLANANSVMQITQYNVITAGTGYTVGNVLRKTTFFNNATGATTTKWYNVSTTAVLAAAPNLAHLSARTDKIGAIGQLPAVLGKLTQAESLSVVVSNTGSAINTSTTLYDVTTDGTGYAIGDVLRRLEIFDSQTKTTATYWYNLSTTADIAAPIDADVVARPVSTADQKFALTNSIKFYNATVAGTGYAIGDVLRRLEIFDPATKTTSYYWYNVTTGLDVATAPLPANIVAQVDLIDSSVVHNTFTYTVTTDGVGYVVGDTIFEVQSLDPTTGVVSSVWRNVTQDAIIAAPLMADLSLNVEVTDTTQLTNTYKFTVVTDDAISARYVVGDIIDAYEFFDKTTLATSIQWKNITQNTVISAPVLADLSVPVVVAPLQYTQLPASLGLQDAADSLSVVVANQDNKVLRGTMTYTVVTAATGYAIGDTLQQFFLLNKETFETEIVWRNATQNTILATAPVLANLSTGTLSADVQYNQLPDSLGKKAAASSLSVVLATDPTKQLQTVYNYTATVANGVHYSVNDFIRRMDYTDFSTGEVLTVWRNVTQNKIITTINFPDFSPIGDTRGLLYTQLPTSLGKKSDANSLSVVVSNATTKVLDSSTTYTATANAANGTDYNIGNQIAKYVYLDLADSTTSTVWRNLTANTTIPTPNQAHLGSPVVADPLQYSQLPTSLGVKAEADSLSVVVSNPDGKVWVSSDYYEATAADNDYVLGDKVTKFTYLDIKTSQFVSVWKNSTTNTTIPAPIMANMGPLTGKNPLDASQLPDSLGLKTTANSLSVAVSNQNPSFISTTRYVAIADDSVNSQYLTNDIINKYSFIDPVNDIVTEKWYNVTQQTVIAEPSSGELSAPASTAGLTYEQLPTALGLQDAADSLSVVVADAKAPLLHSSRTYVATVASATPGKYEIGEVVRVVDAFDIINKVSMLTLYNLSTNTVIDEFNIAHFDRLPPDHLLYTQLPTDLGLKDAADSLSVVVADQQNKVVLSVDTYQSFQASVTPGEYAINDIIRRVELQDLSDNTISYVWRNMTTGVEVTNPNILGFNKLSGEPLQYTQLPVSLGLQASDDSLSVVVADQLSDLFIEKKSFTATADQTDVTTGDIVRRYQLYNPVTATTTYKWYNLTQEMDIATPGDTSLFDPYTGDSTAVSNKILYRAEHYKAIVAHTGWSLNDILVKNVFLDLMDNSFTYSWRNLTTSADIPNTGEPVPADVQELGLNTQLPVTLGRKSRDASLSVVQSNPVGQSMTYYKATTANSTYYSVGDILRRWEIVDVYADEIIVRWTNKTKMTQVAAANVNAAHITEVTATEVAFKSVERTPGFYSVTTDGTLAAGTVAASFFNIGTIDATVAGGTLSPGFAVNFEAPKGDTLAAIVYTCDADSTLLINTLT